MYNGRRRVQTTNGSLTMTQQPSTREALHDIDDAGRDAGVELELLSEDDEITEPFDPKEIDVTTESRSLDTLMKRLAINKIDLDPDFQRTRGIWTPEKRSQLIESLLLRIPLPTFYVAEVPDSDDPGDDSWAVVDGIQRLSTIAQFVEPDVLGLKPLRLDGLQYLRKEEGKTYEQLSPALQLRILEAQLTVQVIRKTTPEAVKLNIFARINTGGVPLSAQELRHALTPGSARSLLRSFAASKAFRSAVDDSVSPSRMVDREMVLRFLAFRAEDPSTYRNKDFDDFLRATMKRINSWSKDKEKRALGEFEETMQTCRAIFGRDAFRKRYDDEDPRRPVSKALFEAVAVAIATVLESSGESGRKRLVKRAPKIRRSFMQLMGEREFDRSVSQGTGDPARVRYRFGSLLDLMQNFV